MATIDTSTPQLKIAQKWIDACVSLDANKISALCSRDYKHQVLPKCLGLPEETREEFTLRLVGTLLPMSIKFDVRVHHQIIALKLGD